MSYFAEFGRCLVWAVFVVAVISKSRGRRQFREFVDSLAALNYIPNRLVAAVAAGVVAAEWAVAVLLVVLPVPELRTFGLGLAAALLTCFAVAIGLVLRRGTSAACRCFGGSASAPFGWHHVVRNGALGLIGLAGCYAGCQQTALDLGALAVMAPFGLLAAFLVIRLDEVVALFKPASAAGR
ncbi:MauE/DoxX family redox-associated membrane protein [Asanoa sp. WMMD1127]|uniref:MauE/DoxX family redox-associated membrane protein n=1 Tax=Asanoa sp. WMMD1127 TaxID=3016107 RepID=UPI0024174B31|nr:MauE/DoxX family redox-associated membrane protein [Asanoa sp. WMMD1127]MDG4825004.1 MauE/DoxX family redox-associated membrane protein [Asanoa sp. WMMD1127]